MKVKKTKDLVSVLKEIRKYLDSMEKDRKIRIGDNEVTLPEEVTLEVELEEGEFEVQLKWAEGEVKRKPLVGILMGSESDLPVMKKAAQVLEEVGVTYEMDVSSAHRSPEKTINYARTARERGIEVIIAGAGMAAHLAGVIAANTTLPIIGVPLKSGALSGVDALYSTVQMPQGTPVATVAIDGAKNAAYLALQILSIKYPEIAKSLGELKGKIK